MSVPFQTISVGVVVERRKAVSPWIDHVWVPVEVLHGEPAAAPWTRHSESGEVATFYTGCAVVELHRAETGNYRDNLAAGPRLWVTLRPTGVEAPYDIVAVTADPSEGEGYVSAGDDLMEALPMPASIVDIIEPFVAEHHVDQPPAAGRPWPYALLRAAARRWRRARSGTGMSGDPPCRPTAWRERQPRACCGEPGDLIA